MMTITPKIRIKDAIFYKKILPWLTASASILILLGVILLIVGSGFNAGLQEALNKVHGAADNIPKPSSYIDFVNTFANSTTNGVADGDHLRVSMLNSFGSACTGIGGFSLFVCLYFYVTCYLYRYEAYAEYDAELYDKLEECKDLDVEGSTNLSDLKRKLYGGISENKSDTSTTDNTTTTNNVSTAIVPTAKKYQISKYIDTEITEELGFSISESHEDITATWFANKVNSGCKSAKLLSKIGIKFNENLIAVHAYPYENSVWLTIIDFKQPENNQIIELTDFHQAKNIFNKFHKHSEKTTEDTKVY